MEMKVAKIRKKEETNKVQITEDYSVKNIVKILMILLLVFAAFYAITFFLVKNRKADEGNSPVVIDSTQITLSQLLNRNESEYYVIATKPSLYKTSYVQTNYIDIYNSYINKYKQTEDALKFYYVDLDNALNKKYFGEELNITNEVSELKINDEILIKVSNGEISKTYVGKDKIIDKLSRL